MSEKELAALDSGESPYYAARPRFVTPPTGVHWDTPLLLLTERRLVVIKQRTFGRPRVDFAVPWGEVSGVSGEPWNGDFMNIRLEVQTRRGIVEIISNSESAVEVESAIRRGYLAS